MPRLSGQVMPAAAPGAPLSYRLSEEVYAMDGLGSAVIVEPGARLKVGPHGGLYETLGRYTGPAVGPHGRGHYHAVGDVHPMKTFAWIAAIGIGAWFLLNR